MQKILLQNSTTCSVVFLLRTAVGGTETLSFCRARKRLTKFYLLSRSYLRSVFPLFKTHFVSCAQSGAHTGACESARQGAVTLICHQRKHGADRRHIVSVCHAATGKTKHFTLIFKKSVKAKIKGVKPTLVCRLLCLPKSSDAPQSKKQCPSQDVAYLLQRGQQANSDVKNAKAWEYNHRHYSFNGSGHEKCCWQGSSGLGIVVWLRLEECSYWETASFCCGCECNHAEGEWISIDQCLRFLWQWSSTRCMRYSPSIALHCNEVLALKG